MCVGGRNSDSMIYLYFYFHTYGYANDIILLYDYWMKGLVTDDIITCNKDSLGAEFSLYLLFYNFPLFSEIFISIDEYAN